MSLRRTATPPGEEPRGVLCPVTVGRTESPSPFDFTERGSKVLGEFRGSRPDRPSGVDGDRGLVAFLLRFPELIPKIFSLPGDDFDMGRDSANKIAEIMEKGAERFRGWRQSLPELGQ